jgi:leucyl/phenylalanyl-tRNA--protein transferase
MYLLNERLEFPHPEYAREEDGLLAIGGDLGIKRLVLAYCNGIFPWYSEGDPICWWSPDPRFVLFPEKLHVPRRLERILRQGRFRITFDRAFDQVIGNCSAVRRDQGQDTWLTREMIHAYSMLYRAGFAMSAEAWQDGELAGGLYGVVLGRVFCGESMFTKVPDASKAAFVTLVRQLESWGFRLVDCQMRTAHLQRFGAEEISRSRFLSLLDRYTGRWCGRHRFHLT